ncbi:GDSL-type esterase/lipase family protein [Salinibacterium sp. TMP30]|uniref:GDSL-type esterase/lipase family protein n=1 Tax=Salinibacterium sp. TMP30 TaxID=3138237 RepID=UPI0031394AE9
MFATVGHIAMKSFMLLWLYTSPHSWRGLPTPEPGPPVVVDGPKPQRVLVCGSGIVVGYGVASYELALGGSLARSLSTLTGRGAEVSTIAGPRMATQAAKSRLKAEVLDGLDAVVLSFGTFDLLSFLPANVWGRGMSELVDSVLAQSQSQTQVFIMNCTAPKMSKFPSSYRRHLLRLTSAYNDEIRSLVQRRDRVHQINFAPKPEDAEAVAGRQSYRTWAEQIAPDIAEELRGHTTGD